MCACVCKPSSVYTANIERCSGEEEHKDSVFESAWTDMHAQASRDAALQAARRTKTVTCPATDAKNMKKTEIVKLVELTRIIEPSPLNTR